MLSSPDFKTGFKYASDIESDLALKGNTIQTSASTTGTVPRKLYSDGLVYSEACWAKSRQNGA